MCYIISDIDLTFGVTVNSAIHPGQVLWKQFMQPRKLSQNALGRALQVSPRRINELVHGKRSLTPDSAIRLAHYFGTSEKFWLELQDCYDVAEAKKKIATDIRLIIKPYGR